MNIIVFQEYVDKFVGFVVHKITTFLANCTGNFTFCFAILCSAQVQTIYIMYGYDVSLIAISHFNLLLHKHTNRRKLQKLSLKIKFLRTIGL